MLSRKIVRIRGQVVVWGLMGTLPIAFCVCGFALVWLVLKLATVVLGVNIGVWGLAPPTIFGALIVFVYLRLTSISVARE